MLRDTARELILQPGVAGTLSWNARIESQGTPWVVVVVPDNDLSRKMELIGTP
jgi:hypothetical protein